MTTKIPAEYAYWHARLTGQQIDTHPETPQPGRWRLPAGQINRRDGAVPKSWPVAIWYADDRCHVKIGKKLLVEGADGDAYHEFVTGGWLRVVAVSEADYNAAMAGNPWPDENIVVTRSNLAPDDNSFEHIRDTIEDLAGEAERLIKAGAATTQEVADQAADVANRLSQLQRRAKDAELAETKPIRDNLDEVRGKWKVPQTRADVYSRLKQIVLTPFLNAKKAADDRARAEAAKAGTPMAEPQRGESVTTAGTRGRPVSMVTIKKAKITDYDKAVAFFKNSEKMKELVQDMANAAVRSGITPDGCEVETTTTAR